MGQSTKPFAGIFKLLLVLSALAVSGVAQAKPAAPPASAAVLAAAELIVQAQYDEAAARLEQILAETPEDKEAAIYLGTARAYKETDSLKAKQHFEEAINKGGGASFIVKHSHEVTLMSVGDPNDYCRGWLHLRKGEMIFSTNSSDHGVRIAFSDISEIKQIRKLIFQVKFGKEGKYNFSPRNRDEREVLMILVMHQKLSRK